MVSPALWRQAALLAFTAAVALVLYMALKPATTHSASIWDKAQHFGAFYVLAWLGAAAFARRTLLPLVAGLIAFGALIEVLQAMPLIHRDAEFADLAADTFGVAAALGPMLLPRIRDWLAR